MRLSISYLTTITTSQKLMPSGDTYIEDSTVNDEIDSLLTGNLLLKRNDVIGSSLLFPVSMVWVLPRNIQTAWSDLRQVWVLVIVCSMTRWTFSFEAVITSRGKFRVRGDVVGYPSFTREHAFRVEFLETRLSGFVR